MTPGPPHFPPPLPDSGDRLAGCLLGCACQVGFCILGWGLLALLNMAGFGWNVNRWLFSAWGVTQWIALAPLILRQKSKGHPKTVQGMIISGCLGTLLGSACAAMFWASTRPGM